MFNIEYCIVTSKNKIKFFIAAIKKIIRTIKLSLIFIFKKKEHNFYFFSERLSEKLIPLGVLFEHLGIDFCVVGYSADEVNKSTSLDDDLDKIYIVCEGYDKDNKIFFTRNFHQDFVLNRLKVLHSIVEEER